MSAFQRRRIADEFRMFNGKLTRPQLAEVGGPRWLDRVKEMRAAGYEIVGEDASGCWHLTLETLPAEAQPLDARRAVVALPGARCFGRVDSSPGTVPDPHVEGEPEPLALPIEDERKAPLNHHHHDVEAA